MSWRQCKRPRDFTLAIFGHRYFIGGGASRRSSASIKSVGNIFCAATQPKFFSGLM
jgi:hypothetical protein